jgi:regulator of sirC expression with transglutaminase-like and TPR domain
MDQPLPLFPPDPSELSSPPGEVFRRQVRAHTLLEAAEFVDAERRAEIGRELLKLGDDALRALQKAAVSRHENSAALARNLIRQMVPNEIGKQLFSGLVQQKNNYAIEEGAALLARLPNPSLSVKRVLRDLEILGNKCRKRVYGDLGIAPDEGKIAVRERTMSLIVKLNMFWRDEGFHGGADSYHGERNSYLPDVLERRTGLPIAMTVPYIALARRLHLEADGVGMPGHFIVRIKVHTKTGDQYVMIDPFIGAQPVDVNDCRQRVESAGHPFSSNEDLTVVPPRDMLIRMCNNLLALFDHQGKPLESERVATVLTHLQPSDPVPLLIRAERRLRRGDRRGARADFGLARKLDPSGPAGRAAWEFLRRMEQESPFL